MSDKINSKKGLTEKATHRIEHNFRKSSSEDNKTVLDWIAFMKSQGVARVCCLLNQDELPYYSENLMSVYGKEFGEKNIWLTPKVGNIISSKINIVNLPPPHLHKVNI